MSRTCVLSPTPKILRETKAMGWRVCVAFFAVAGASSVPSAPLDFAAVTQRLSAVVEGERDHVANLANVAALLWKEYNDARGPGAVNWVGFYLSASEEQRRRKELKLGPFVGKPAVTRIPFSRGVCGAAARSACTKLVKDVHEFEGHIACDEASQSEIVVPLLADDGSVLGVLDMDCPTVGGFTYEDQTGLEELCRVIVRACDWPTA